MATQGDRMRTNTIALSTCLVLCLTLTPQIVAQDETSPVDELVVLIKDGELQARRDAIHELAKRGLDAKEAVPTLIELLEDNDPQMWYQATVTLGRIGPEAESAIPALIEKMRAHGGQRLIRTAYALSQIGAAAIPALIKQLEGDNERGREGAVRALGGMGPAAAPAIPQLIALLADDDSAIREQAAVTLGGIGTEAEDALSAVLQHESEFVRVGALKALKAIGPQSKEVVGRLHELAKSDSSTQRAATLEVLGTTSVGREQTLSLLVEALSDEDERIRQASVIGLHQSGESAASVVPKIATLL